jgi:hypothetical protein
MPRVRLRSRKRILIAPIDFRCEIYSSSETLFAVSFLPSLSFFGHQRKSNYRKPRTRPWHPRIEKKGKAGGGIAVDDRRTETEGKERGE